MNLAEKILDEMELCEFYSDRNGAANIIGLFQIWANKNLSDPSEVVELLNVEWRKAHHVK